MIAAYVVDPRRFKTDNHFHSYCGLVKLDRISGGKSYGRRDPDFCRQMKSVFKTAAIAAIYNNNPMADYYNYLLETKHLDERRARSAIARRIATLSLGVWKSGQKYKPWRYSEKKSDS